MTGIGTDESGVSGAGRRGEYAESPDRCVPWAEETGDLGMGFEGSGPESSMRAGVVLLGRALLLPFLDGYLPQLGDLCNAISFSQSWKRSSRRRRQGSHTSVSPNSWRAFPDAWSPVRRCRRSL